MKQMMPFTKLEEAKITKPPFWTLGHHVCRNTSDQEASFKQDIEKFMNLSDKAIPYDSDCIGQGLLKTAFSVNNHSYENDEKAFENLKEDFSILDK